jgi:hypothetical protein
MVSFLLLLCGLAAWLGVRSVRRGWASRWADCWQAAAASAVTAAANAEVPLEKCRAKFGAPLRAERLGTSWSLTKLFTSVPKQINWPCVVRLRIMQPSASASLD